MSYTFIPGRGLLEGRKTPKQRTRGQPGGDAAYRSLLVSCCLLSLQHVRAHGTHERAYRFFLRAWSLDKKMTQGVRCANKRGKSVISRNCGNLNHTHSSINNNNSSVARTAEGGVGAETKPSCTLRASYVHTASTSESVSRDGLLSTRNGVRGRKRMTGFV